MLFWQFFRQGRDGRALLVQPSRIPHMILKIIFALNAFAHEFLAMLEGKLERPHFLKVQSGKITVCEQCSQIVCYIRRLSEGCLTTI